MRIYFFLIIFFIFPLSSYSSQTNTPSSGITTYPNISLIENKIIYVKSELHKESENQEILTSYVISSEADGDNIDILLKSDERPIINLSPSPDGKKFLFTTNDISDDPFSYANMHIWLYENGVIHQLTNGRVRDSDPAWSSDGENIFFTRYHISITSHEESSDNPESNFTSLYVSDGNIWSMDKNGQNQTVLTSNNHDNEFNFSPSPSKDGKHVLYSTNKGSQDPNNPEWKIYIMDSDGKNHRLFIEKGLMPTWSPDGNTVAYLNQSPGNIHLADKHGKPIKAATQNARIAYSPSWSPDQQFLTYSQINLLPENKPKDFSLIQIEASDNSFTDVWMVGISDKTTPSKVSSGGTENNFPQWVSRNRN